jgi:long-chain acyl-CoA synthetase
LVAVVVLDEAKAKDWIVGQGLPQGTEMTDEVMESMKKDVLADMDRLAKANNFSGLEKIKKVHLTMDAFTIENDLLTPTMKLKRNIAKKVFADQIT